jgi:prophage antirepressor-like protein
MKQENAIQLFENKKVRTVWDTEQEKWFISIIDVIEVLTETDRSRKYWSDLKAKLKKEGSQVSENIGHLKMIAPDGKMRMTDVADTEQLFRLIQ